MLRNLRTASFRVASSSLTRFSRNACFKGHAYPTFIPYQQLSMYRCSGCYRLQTFSTATNQMWYTKTHEYVCFDGSSDILRLGVSAVAIEQLGEVAYVELPKVGDAAIRGEVIATVASVKAVGDVYSPISGTVTEVNDAIDNDPMVITNEPETSGWICKIKLDVPTLPTDMLTKESYEEHCAEEQAAHE